MTPLIYSICIHFSSAPAIVEGNSETATVVDLFPWTEYEFRVIATNTLGTGEPSIPSPKVQTLEAGKELCPGVGLWLAVFI